MEGGDEKEEERLGGLSIMGREGKRHRKEKKNLMEKYTEN
jgi:hypothetical protein